MAELSELNVLTTRCCACGRPITPAEAYQRLELGDIECFVCCPMCLDALHAGAVQRKMIPESFANERVDVLVEYFPARQIGGDYVHIRDFGDAIHFLVLDVSGHGITSSLVMSRVSTLLDRLLDRGDTPADVAGRLNVWMREHVGDARLYATMFHAVLDFRRARLLYLSCGHAAQLLWSQRREGFLRLESQTTPIGLFDEGMFEIPDVGEVAIQPGDRLVLFTDGLPDIERPGEKQLGYDGLIRMLTEPEGEPTAESARRLIAYVRSLGQEARNDDVLFVFAEVKDTARAA